MLNTYIEYISEQSGIGTSVLEKDYFVTLFLKRLIDELPSIIFKGDTSLSKAFKAISRFSEDIDLSIVTEGGKPSESVRRKLKESIVTTWVQCIPNH